MVSKLMYARPVVDRRRVLGSVFGFVSSSNFSSDSPSVRDSPRALTGEHPSTHRTNSVPVLPEQAAWIAVFQGFFKHAPLRVTSGKLV